MRALKINRFLALSIVSALLIVGSSLLIAQATSEDDIVYPVEELDGCVNEDACFRFCNNPDNFSSCFAFAKKHNLIRGPIADEEDIDRFAEVIKDGGPGGCRTHKRCEDYCNDVSRIDACHAFVLRTGVLSQEKLGEITKIKTAIDQGAQLPGGCRNKKDCETYCNNPNHTEECFSFAERAGFIPKEEIEQARKFMEVARRRGGTPGNCKFEECKEYCENPNHAEICLNYAEEAGMIKPGEVEMARKFLQIMKERGGGPGGCKGQGCKDYCEAEEHQDECFEFFAAHDLIPEEARTQMREGLARMGEALDKAPEAVRACFNEKLGPDILAKIGSGDFDKPAEMRRIGETMRACFEAEFGGEGFRGGPGGLSFPPEIEACLKEQGVDTNFQGPPPTNLREIIEKCYVASGITPGGPGGIPGGHFEPDPAMMQACREELGIKELTPESAGRMRECVERKFSGGFPGAPGALPGGAPTNIPSDIREKCMQAAGITTTRPPTQEEIARVRECIESSFGREPSQIPSGIPSPDQQFAPQPGTYPTNQYQQQYQQQLQQQIQQQTQEQTWLLQQQGCTSGGGAWDQTTHTCLGQPFAPPPNFLPPPPDPATICANSYPGCVWTGTTCQCPTPPPPQSRLNPPSLLGFFAQILLGEPLR